MPQAFHIIIDTNALFVTTLRRDEQGNFAPLIISPHFIALLQFMQSKDVKFSLYTERSQGIYLRYTNNDRSNYYLLTPFMRQFLHGEAEGVINAINNLVCFAEDSPTGLRVVRESQAAEVVLSHNAYFISDDPALIRRLSAKSINIIPILQPGTPIPPPILPIHQLQHCRNVRLVCDLDDTLIYLNKTFAWANLFLRLLNHNPSLKVPFCMLTLPNFIALKFINMMTAKLREQGIIINRFSLLTQRDTEKDQSQKVVFNTVQNIRKTLAELPEHGITFNDYALIGHLQITKAEYILRELQKSKLAGETIEDAIIFMDNDPAEIQNADSLRDEFAKLGVCLSLIKVHDPTAFNPSTTFMNFDRLRSRSAAHHFFKAHPRPIAVEQMIKQLLQKPSLDNLVKALQQWHSYQGFRRFYPNRRHLARLPALMNCRLVK